MVFATEKNIKLETGLSNRFFPKKKDVKKPAFDSLRKPTFGTVDNMPKDVGKSTEGEAGRLKLNVRGISEKRPSFGELRVKRPSSLIPGTVRYEIPKEPTELRAVEPSGFLQKALGYTPPAKPSNWEYASPIEKFSYATLPISDFLGRVGSKITEEIGVTKPEEKKRILSGHLAEDLEWYQKTPETMGWGAEKVAEYIALSGVFKLTGLHSILTKVGQKAARPFMLKALSSPNGIRTLKTLSPAGLRSLGRQTVTSFLRAAPENTAFISSWSALDALMKGKPPKQIGVEAAKGAGWGLGLTAGLSALGTMARAPEIKMAFSRAISRLNQKYPKLADFLGKDVKQEVMDSWLAEYSRVSGRDVRFVDLTKNQQARFRNMVRTVEKELIKRARKEEALRAYYASGVREAKKPSELLPAKRTPEEVAAFKREAAEVIKKEPIPVKSGLEGIAEELPEVKAARKAAEAIKKPPPAVKEKITPKIEPEIGVEKPKVAEELLAKPVVRAEPKYQQAKQDFERMVSKATPKEIEKAKTGYGIGAMRFARQYLEPKENQELYNKIYNIYHDYFEKLEAKPPVEPTKVEKKPWEMTREEFVKTVRGMAIPLSEMPLHRVEVENAVKQGKPVRREVLEEYKSEEWARRALRAKLKTEVGISGRRKILQERIRRGEKVPEKLLQEYKSETWAQEALAKEPTLEKQIETMRENLRTGTFPKKTRVMLEKQLAELEALKEVEKPAVDKKLIEGWLPKIRTKLIEREVKNLSDAELKRAFKGTTAENRLIEYAKLMRESGDLKYEDIAKPEAKIEGKDVTQEKLSELRGQVGRTSERYGITQARAAKSLSKTEQNMLERLPDELDLGPWSGVLLYSPELKGFSKSEHSAVIKLIDRGNLQLFREDRPVSKKYSSGFTYVLRKSEQPPAQVKPTGKVGFPARPTAEEMPTAMEYLAKEPISAKEIITHLSKSLKVPYASMATHRRRTAAGFYEVRPVGIRQVNVRDLGTAAHEVGHHIDYFWKIRRAGISKIGRRTWKMPEGTAKGTAAELTKLGKMLYGDKKPKGGYKGEGIAEFVRGYLTEHIDIRKEAPHFYKWFVEDYLPNNPEIANALHNAKGMLTEYRLQGAEARIESQISRKEINATIANRVKMANLWMQEMFVDEFAPLRVGMEEVGIERAKLKPSEDPYELAVFFSQKEGARARQMVLFGTIDLWGNKTGKGLKEIMKPISDQNAVREFTHWIVSARSLDLWKRGINPGISKKDAQYVYDLYKGNEGWQETAKEITDWNHRVLDYLVQGGALQKDVADRMVKLNPIYIPFMRAFAKGEKRFGGGGAGRGLITTKKGVFSIKGSGREIIDPFESMITQTRRMISIAHKSVIARALAKLERQYRGLAGFIWKVPAPKRATTFQAEQVKKQLMKMGVEFPEAGLEKMDALLTVYGNSPIYFGKENIICIVENGKRNWYEVSPEMYRLLQGLDKFYLPRFLNLTMGKAARSVRLGATGINASFGLVTNPIRDSLDTIFKGTHARGPGASIMGVAKDLSRLGLAKSLGIEPSKAAQEYVSMGGQISGFIGQDRKSLQHLKGEMLASSVGKYSAHTVGHPIDALREVFGVAESGPRIQEYEKALEFGEKKYGKGSPDAKVYAFNKAQDQTINYSRHGVLGKWLNQMIPFWNANVQDISKVHRTFRTRGKQATAYAVAFLTLPAMGLWWYNKDEEWYKELPAFEKANYLHIRLPGKYKYLRIPVPFLVGHIFQGFPVAISDALYRADKTKVTQFFGQVLKGDVYPLTEWPAIVSPVIDVLQNKDWAGRPIVPRGVEGKMPSDRYKEYTTEFCKVIGKIFNYSPAKIEHLLNSWSGGLYRRTGAMTEKLLGLKKTEMQPAEWPVIGRLFVRDPYAPKASIERFYKEKERLNRMYQSQKIIPGSDLDKKRKRYNSISTKYLSPRWKALIKTKTIKQRERIYREIGALVKQPNK